MPIPRYYRLSVSTGTNCPHDNPITHNFVKPRLTINLDRIKTFRLFFASITDSDKQGKLPLITNHVSVPNGSSIDRDNQTRFNLIITVVYNPDFSPLLSQPFQLWPCFTGPIISLKTTPLPHEDLGLQTFTTHLYYHLPLISTHHPPLVEDRPTTIDLIYLNPRKMVPMTYPPL